MTLDLFFKLAFYVIFLSFAAMMTIYTRKAKARKEATATRHQLHNEHEVPLLLRLRQVFGVPFYMGLLVWTFAPGWMTWSALPLPQWLRWVGVALGIFAVFLNGWSHRTLGQKLGEDFDPALRLLEVPALVTEGPFRFLRHPIYAAFLLMQISTLLLTANWFVGALGLSIILSVIVLRVPEEEKMLARQFGDAYRHYMNSTGRFLPRLPR